MRLAELKPRWIAGEGDAGRLGFTFLCPHCRETRLFCALIGLPTRAQFKALASHHPESRGDIVPAKQMFAWNLAKGSTFDDMSITPSVDASASGHWHGYITDGQIVGGI